MRRRRKFSDPGLVEVVLELAWTSPEAGTAVCCLLVIFGFMFRSAAFWSGTLWALAGPLLATLFLFVGGAGLLVCGIAILHDELFGR